MNEIKEKIKDLELALNYVCYDADLITKLQTVWQKQVLLQEVVNKNDFIADVMPRTFSKQSLKDAYIQGYRKRAIMSGLKYDNISELNAVAEFENWYVNLYEA